VIVGTSGAGKPGAFDCLSRYFAAWNGIAEDPVTGIGWCERLSIRSSQYHVAGSAHTVLAAYWGAQLGKAELNGSNAFKVYSFSHLIHHTLCSPPVLTSRRRPARCCAKPLC
jgi:hypothetical protein